LQDLVTGPLKKVEKQFQHTQDDVVGLRRETDKTSREMISGNRKAETTIKSLGKEIGKTSDKTKELGRSKVSSIFTRAKRGADQLYSSVGRTASRIKGMASNARVNLRANDNISPAIDGISSKLATLAATAGGIVLGGGIKDSLFGGVTDYYSEVARSAALLPEDIRTPAVKNVDDLYKQGLFASRSEGVQQLANAAPLVRDKSKMNDFVNESAKIQYIRPDSGAEEINRALAQSADTFKESYSQVADSMMYAYKEVGDRQQDLFDTFWEYSGYFKNAGTTSGQMSNFLVKSVQDGAFNFDKPGDFFKEVFGVKALNQSDMASYFTSRGAGSEEADRQATAFSADINSGDQQRMKGALAAFIGDLASQTEDQLKQSLVTLGSATAEDNGLAALKNYRTAFEAAPSDVVGTTDRLVTAQKEANPMQSSIEARRQVDLQMQDIGANLSTAALPALQEFNKLITENKDSIQTFGSTIAGFISGLTGFYKDHFNVINGVLGTLGAGFLAKKGWDGFQKGKNVVGNIVGLFTGKKNKNKPGSGLGGLGDMLSPSSGMTINASVVYLNGSIGGGMGGDFFDDFDGGSDRKRGKGTRTKRTRRRGRNRRRGMGFGSRLVSGFKNATGGFMGNRGTSILQSIGRGTKAGGNWLSNLGKGLLGGGGKVLKGAAPILKGVVKGAGIAGTIANVGMSAYDLYQTAKDKGIREAISTRGGSVAGSIGGGAVGGAIGSLAGPIGTAAGAAVGSWVGEKLGSLADSSGATRWVVDKTVELKDSVVSLANNVGDKFKNFFGFGSKKEEPSVNPTVRNKVIKPDFNVSNAKEAEKGVAVVGIAATLTANKTTAIGQKSKKSFTEVMNGSQKAGKSFSNVSAAALKESNQTKQYLMSLKNIVSQGSLWGSNLISMMASGMRNSFPTLNNAVGAAAGVIQNFLGFHSPTKEGPASDSDRWAGNFVTMFAGGLRADPIRQRMSLIARSVRNSIEGIEGTNLSNGSIPVRTTPLTGQATPGSKSVAIGNITLDFGTLASGITDFQSFAKALTSPEGRALIRNVFGEELYKALEVGG
jgi:hypothetical protein